MWVELEIFSGQPNPAWELTEIESAEFLRRIQLLPTGGDGTVRNELGYRGFKVTALDDLSALGFSILVVSSGVVLAQSKSSEKRLVDADREVERWLLRSGEGRIDKALFEEISSELDAE